MGDRNRKFVFREEQEIEVVKHPSLTRWILKILSISLFSESRTRIREPESNEEHLRIRTAAGLPSRACHLLPHQTFFVFACSLRVVGLGHLRQSFREPAREQRILLSIGGRSQFLILFLGNVQ